MSQMISRRFTLILTLVAMPLLVGSECAFFFSSGGNDNDKIKKKVADVVVIQGDGQFVDAPVSGVNYESGSIAGITGSNGEFQYEIGSSVRFFIGDIALGRAVQGKSLITPLDLVADGAADTPAVLNIARLLQSLDSEPGDDVITIPAAVRAAAVRSNEGLSPFIEFLDFSDDAAFANAASHLVAALTHDYPFTAALVDADHARTHLLKSIDKWEK